MRPFLLLLGLVSLNTFAAEFSFIDFRSCRYESVTNEPQENTELYMEWQVRANSLPSSDESEWGVDGGWSVYYTGSDQSFFGSIGICRQTYHQSGSPLALICRNESYKNFPLAGATFKILDDGGRYPTFRCVVNCKQGIPKQIFEEGFEGEQHDKVEKLLKKFVRVCPKK